MKKLVVIASALVVALAAAGCKEARNEPAAVAEKKPTAVVVGTSPLVRDVLTAAKPEFDKDGYVMELKVFDDFVTPDVALNEGSIDVNFYQHEPFLNQFNKNRGTELEKYGSGIIRYFMGIFSKKHTSLDQMKSGASVAVPNDPSNRARALKVLQHNGLIKLKDGVEQPTKLDIESNPRKLNIIETDTLQQVTALNDVDYAVINSYVASQGGVDAKSVLAVESEAESAVYSLIIVLKKGSGKESYAEHLEKALKSTTVKQFLEEKYQGAVLPMF